MCPHVSQPISRSSTACLGLLGWHHPSGVPEGDRSSLERRTLDRKGTAALELRKAGESSHVTFQGVACPFHRRLERLFPEITFQDQGKPWGDCSTTSPT